MALYIGDCNGCGRQDIEIFESNHKCIICARLDNIENKIEKLQGDKENG